MRVRLILTANGIKQLQNIVIKKLNHVIMGNKKELLPKHREELLSTLKKRFEKNRTAPRTVGAALLLTGQIYLMTPLLTAAANSAREILPSLSVSILAMSAL